MRTEGCYQAGLEELDLKHALHLLFHSLSLHSTAWPPNLAAGSQSNLIWRNSSFPLDSWFCAHSEFCTFLYAWSFYIQMLILVEDLSLVWNTWQGDVVLSTSTEHGAMQLNLISTFMCCIFSFLTILTRRVQFISFLSIFHKHKLNSAIPMSSSV